MIELHLSQKEIYFDHVLDSKNPQYNIGTYVVITGNLNVGLFKESISSSASVFDVFKFKNFSENSPLVFIKEASSGIEITELDLTNKGWSGECIKQWLQERINRPFDIHAGYLYDFVLVKRKDGEHWFYIGCHHLFSDGYGVPFVFLSYIFDKYHALRTGGDKTFHYPGYLPLIEKSNEYLTSSSYESDRNYWRAKFITPQEPIFQKRLKSTSFQTDSIQRSFTLKEQKKLRAFCFKNEISLQDFLIAILTVYYKRTNCLDFFDFCLPIHNRNDRKERQTLGVFAKLIPCRIEIDNPKLSELFSVIKRNQRHDYRHKQFPVSHFNKLIQADTNNSSKPFDICVNYRYFRLDTAETELNLKGFRMDATYSIIPIEFGWCDFAEKGNENLFLEITFRKDYFKKAEIDLLGERVLFILDQFCNNSDDNISSINIIPEKERSQLLVAFNNTSIQYPQNKTIVELFEEQVEKTPDNIAVVFEGKELSYRELDMHSSKLADYLQKNYQIEPDDLIAIHQDRSEWIIISILGVLKAGGAYVSIDTEYPQDRVDYILKDTKCKVCIDESELKRFKENRRGAKMRTSSFAKPSNLAYVTYTSGSTGKPKGVMIEHSSLFDYTITFAKKFEINGGDKCIQQSSFSFDTHAEEIYPILINGGRLLMTRSGGRDMEEIKELIQEQKATILDTTPHVLSELNTQRLDIGSLRFLMSGGDVLDVSHIDYFIGRLKIYNSYGPSESTICSTFHEIEDCDSLSLIGKPISNREIYLVNRHRQLVPIGVIGEICISGTGLARGYLNLADITKDKFITNPFSKGGCLYMTGDLGRWLPDGNIEFIGRKDDQVKIRGYRIELGEIEHALLKNAKIKEAVVIVKANENKEKELVAYITSKEEQNTSELRSYLKELLPEYMLPACYVQLEALPLNSNGKVDKKSLPDPEGLGLSRGIEYVAPRNETEKNLVKIWEEVLKKENIGVKDNFFSLGGHSLKAVRLSNEYQKELAVKISLKDLFVHICIESHAELIQSSQRSKYIQIEKVAQQAFYPISDAQRRLWILSQFEEGSVAYNMPGDTYLNRGLDINCFKRAIESTIERHEILRTVFKVFKEDESGEIRQWILNKEDLGFKIDYRDYRKENNTDEKVKEYITADSYKAFDLEKGPLLRAGLLQVEDERYVFYLNMHHIISDGWSMEVLSKDVMSYYDAYKENKEPALKPLRIQYKDYSAWQLGQLKEESYKDHRAYWLKSLEGELPLLNLPSAKQQRPRIKTSNGRTLRTYLNKEVSDMLKKYSQEKGGSLFMGLLASWNVILYRYTGQQDMIIGSPVAGREHADLEDQIGFYVNTLALRNEIDPEESFDSLFLRVKQKTLTAYSHQMYPFDKLVEELNLVRDTSRSAVFDVMLVLQNNGERVEGVELKEEELNQITDHGYCTSRFDMEISVQEIGDYLVLQVGYNPDVYEKEMVEGLMKHYNQLLKALLKDPGEALSQIDYLSESEKHQLLVTFNDTGVDYPKDKTIVELFGDQAEKTPHNIAVVFEENKLTYGQLDEKSNQLAHYLQKNYDIKPDDLVGIKLDRSEWMIVSVLGVLKAGGAYVPIDPEYPRDRIDYIEKDTRCKVCVDEKELNCFRKDEKQYSKKKVSSKIKPANLAYVIYTSGSTGRPKGVMIEHANLVSFMSNLGSKFRLEKIRKIAGSTNLTFDISVLEIFGSLCSGKELIVLSKDELNDPHKFLEKIERSEVDGLQLTPSRLSQIYSVTSSLPKVISLVLIGGEALSELLYATLKKESFESINVYGPTETTIWSTSLNISDSQRLSIGAPLSNENAYILNGEQLQPVGVVGELCIGGDGLSRGYLNQDDLTKEKFISNPFKAGERMYKTGDLGRWLPDGNIEFIGRKDDQVKIRGYRIELGEIEHALQSHLEIDSAVVLAKENKQGEKELVAYIIAKAEQHAGELRSYLKELLPEYMLPAYYVQLEVMPLTSNGKVDKRSLPDPAGLGLSSGLEYVAPRNEIEEKLVKIWEEVLQREHIGIKDDFFALGGHSLKATRLSSQVYKVLEVQLSLRELFNCTILESQAELISKAKKTSYVNISRVEESLSYAISSAQRRLWVLSQLTEGNVAYNMPGVHVFEGALNREELLHSFMTLISRHEILRTVFNENENGEVRQWIKDESSHGFSIEYMDLRNVLDQDERVRALVQSDIERPFDLVKGPLIRSQLIQISDVKYVFTYTMHHIISDGWSMGVMIRELLSLYNSYIYGLTNPLSPLRIQYKDYSSWQQQELKGDVLNVHKSYWLQQFSGELPVLELPSDRIRPAIKSYNGGVINRILNKELTGGIRRLSQMQGGTLFMGLLGAVNALLYRYTNQEDIIIGSPIAGREHVDMEDQVGFYVNTLALRTRFKGSDSYNDLLGIIRKTTLEAYEHQMYPFDELVDDLNLRRDMSRNALFDVMVVLQNNDMSTREGLEDIKVGEYRGGERVVSLFDLRLDFREFGEALHLIIEYSSDIYDRETINRFGNHFEQMLSAIIASPDRSINKLDYLGKEEYDQLLLEFNATQVDYPKDKTLVDLFEIQAEKKPNNIVVTDWNGSYTYLELDKRSNQLSRFLKEGLGLLTESRVGILQSRSKELIVLIMGILKAGGAYVPLDVDYPEDRLLYMLEDAGVEVLLTEKRIVEFATRLQWRSKKLKHLVFIDSDNIYKEQSEIKNELMEKALWDHVGDTSTGAISGGGWISSYTGEYMSEIEMQEYSQNAYKKLQMHLYKDMKVLEIGCSSGLTMFQIAPEVGQYFGTDLSSSILAKTHRMVQEKGHSNITLSCLPAHEIDKLEEIDFDLIIINSVIHCFDGHNYLRNVLVKALSKMKEKGLIFLGDVMDEDKRQLLIDELLEFKHVYREKNYRTKTDWSSELFISQDYLNDLVLDNIGIIGANYSDKIYTVENELTNYRYDALLQVDKGLLLNGSKKKYQYDLSAISSFATTSLDLALRSENLAYVIYTSGSTGKPKGCMLENRGIVNRIEWMWQEYGFNTEDIILQKTTFTFDVSVWEIFMPLCWGGSMVMCQKEDISSPERVLNLINLHKISCLHFVPSILNAFISSLFEDYNNIKLLNSIRRVITSGEALSLETVKKWYEKSDIVIHNLYGPTEASIDVTYYKTSQADIKIPIGRPIWNTQMYVLDAQHQLSPIGIIGEICIGGDGLARGYLNNIELTVEKFIANPFKAGERLYKTGDLGRWTKGGNIEFIGRKDDQVKIRGYRIELGEIENALLNNQEIEEAVVVVKENENKEKELVAYVTSKTDQNISELRSYLKEHLPEYMLPAYYVQLEALPLTSNGKINKKSLPDPQGLGLASGVEYVAPRNETEKKLVKIWEEILKRENIGIKDDFFVLGGHSLKAVRLSNEYQKELRVKILLRDLFVHTTIGSHAELIHFSKKTDFIQIEPVPLMESYPISDAQRRLWVLSQFEEGSVAYNTPGDTYLNREIDIHCFTRAIESTIERHEILRTVFKEDESGEVRQWILSKEELGFRIDYKDYRKEQIKDEAVKKYIKADSYSAFDLEKGPLLRASLLQVEDEEYIFYYNMHHIISDGWSMEVLKKDVFSFYKTYTENKDAALKPLRIQYKDFSAWQLAQLEEESFKVHRAYWLESLKGELPLLDLPAIKQRPKIKTNSGRTFDTYLNKELSEKLKEYSQQRGGTVFMGLLASLNAILYRYTGQTDLIIGSPIAGREHADLEDQIGFYVNTLALRNEIKPGENFDELFSRVKQNTLNAYSHQMYSFDRLVEELELARDTSRSAVFDVMLVLQNNGENDENPELKEGQENQIFDYGYKASKFDLVINIQHQGDYLSLSAEYNTDVYEREMMESFIIHFRQLLASLIKNPDQPLNKIDYLSDNEKVVLLKYSSPEITFDIEDTVVEKFRNEIKKHGNKLAVIYEDKELTYSQLDLLSEEVSNYLRSHVGVQVGDMVGMMIDRSDQLAIITLGILKSGCSYVAIDHLYPNERKQYILRDSGCKVLLAEKIYTEQVQEYWNGLVVNINNISFNGRPLPPVKLSPEDPAFVIYTSGSMGAPKGILQTHKCLLNTVMRQVDYGGFERGLKVLQYSSVSFDVFIAHELFFSLLSGGSLHIIQEEQRKDLMSLGKYIADQGIEWLLLPVSALNVIVEVSEDLWRKDIFLKHIVSAGEQLVLSKRTILYLKEHPEISLDNFYGPSETHNASNYTVDSSGEIAKSQPIGRPSVNTWIYILSEENQLSPIGVIGELYISGAGLAKGYLNKPELTAEKFIPDPFRERELMYKTGDLGRWLPDGNIEFIGRQDDQVKIRGNRVELGEIEGVIDKHEAVGKSVVLTKITGENDKELIAYYVPDIKAGYTIHKIIENDKIGLPKGAKLYELSDGFSFYSYNKSELHFLYEEIFKEHKYIKCGIVIPSGGCIVDVGANIGMFSIYANMQEKGVKIYSYEPLPPIFELLKLNTSLYKGKINAFNIGLSSKEETVSFTYYPNATIHSGRYSNRKEIEQTVKHFLHNTNRLEEEYISDKEVSEILSSSLVSQQYECKLKTLSQIIEENNITQIDLLKINVEKSELDVLEGILEKDWKKIRQIAFEIHDSVGMMEKIKRMLLSHGFNIYTDQNFNLVTTNVNDIYAISGEMVASSVQKIATRGTRHNKWYGLGNFKVDIKEYLTHHLPDYMIPSYFIPIDRLPLNSNGKIDKKALLNLQGLNMAGTMGSVAPRNETEEKLVKMWEKILQRENVGIKDDFFALGGHSLKAVRLSNKYQKELGVKISLRDLFAHTTIESHAELIRFSKKTDFIEIGPVAPTESYPISDAQRRLWVLSQFEEGSVAYNMPGDTYLNRDVDINCFKRAVDATIDRHEVLRTVIKADETGEIRQWILKREELGLTIAYKDFREETNKEEKVKEYITADSYKPFNLEEGPLLRAGLLQVEDESYVFYFNMHHIISDGWSMQVLSRDVMSYYEAYKENKEPDLKPLRIQYKDYSAWQLAELTKKTALSDRKYWEEILLGKLPVLELPFMNKRSPFRSFKGGIWSTFIDHNLSFLLRENCKKNGGTLFHGILASWLVLMHKYSGNKDIIIGTSVAGRNHPDLEDQIGFYSNAIALRNEIDPGSDFTEVLKTVIENTNNSMMHQDYPFLHLVENMELQRDSNRNPVFDSMLVFSNRSEFEDLEDCEKIDCREINHLESRSKFDLEIGVRDMGSLISFNIIYDSDIFDSFKVKNMIVDYKYLLAEILDKLDFKIKDFKIEERARQEVKRINLNKLTSKKI